MLTFAFLGVLLLGVIGWVVALFTMVSRDRNEAERRVAVFALSKLYAEGHVGPCVHDGKRRPCEDGTPAYELCPPCYGRRALMRSSALFTGE